MPLYRGAVAIPMLFPANVRYFLRSRRSHTQSLSLISIHRCIRGEVFPDNFQFIVYIIAHMSHLPRNTTIIYNW